MTNLIASIIVSLVTNVTERFPTLPAFQNAGDSYTLELPYFPHTNPQQKWVKTTIKRVTKATFDWNGKPREVSDEEILNETEVEFRKQDAWAPVATNDVPREPRWGTLNGYATNSIGTNMLVSLTNNYIYFGSLTTTNKP